MVHACAKLGVLRTGRRVGAGYGAGECDRRVRWCAAAPAARWRDARVDDDGSAADRAVAAHPPRSANARQSGASGDLQLVRREACRWRVNDGVDDSKDWGGTGRLISRQRRPAASRLGWWRGAGAVGEKRAKEAWSVSAAGFAGVLKR